MNKRSSCNLPYQTRFYRGLFFFARTSRASTLRPAIKACTHSVFMEGLVAHLENQLWLEPIQRTSPGVGLVPTERTSPGGRAGTQKEDQQGDAGTHTESRPRGRARTHKEDQPRGRTGTHKKNWPGEVRTYTENQARGRTGTHIVKTSPSLRREAFGDVL